jgi:hypothetical protein
MTLELSLCGLMFTGGIVGSLAIYWARSSASSWHALLGRRLFLLTVVVLSACVLLAAYCRAHGLTGLGLCLGLLVAAMLWDVPGAASEGDAPEAAPGAQSSS